MSPQETDTSFEIHLAHSHLTLQVPPHQTILQTLQAAGIEVPFSCSEGICGTCMTGVQEGEPAHRDMYLTPEEQAAGDCLMICVSRSKSARLVLDL